MTWYMIAILVVLILLIFLSAFFSGAETAYSSVSVSQIEINFKKGKKSAKLIKKHSGAFGQTLSTILIANNFVNILASTLFSFFISTFIFGDTAFSPVLATVILTPIIVIFGEILPKLFAKKHSYSYLKKIVYVIEILNFLFFPFTFLIKKIALDSQITNTEKELKTYISIASREKVIEKSEATLAHKALDLDSKKTRSVYVAKKDVVAIDYKTPLKEIKRTFKNKRFSRIPVLKDNKYVGILFFKDIIYAQSGNWNIDKYIIQIPVVSKNMILTNVLEELRKNQSHLCFVSTSAKEKNRVIGIISMEDILEELVGQIYDEYDGNQKIKEISWHKFHVLGTTKVTEVEKALKVKLEKSQNITIQKWIQKRVRRKLKKGLSYLYKSKLKFKVVSNKHKSDMIIEVEQK